VVSFLLPSCFHLHSFFVGLPKDVFPGNVVPGAIMIASSSATGGKFSGTAKGSARSARTPEAVKQSALTSAFLKHGARQRKHEF
jgi:hypothetical protein